MTYWPKYILDLFHLLIFQNLIPKFQVREVLLTKNLLSFSEIKNFLREQAFLIFLNCFHL